MDGHGAGRGPAAVARLLFLGSVVIGLTMLCGPVSPAAPGGVAAAPQGDADSGRAYLRITGDPAGLRIYADSVFLGTTPFESGPLPAGVFRFTVLGADPAEWFSKPVADSILLTPGDTAERYVAYPRTVNIASEPAGAEVRLGDTLLGTTPLIASLPRRAVTVGLRRPGYSDMEVLIPGTLTRYRAVMVPAGPGGAELPKVLAEGDGRSATPVILAVSVAVVSGAASAYLKSRADTYYEDYRRTREGATLDRVRRFDLFAGISLGVTQLSVGYLIVELLSR